MLAILALGIGALFLFCLVIIWIGSCCTSKGANYSRKSIRNLTITLFLLNVVCFLLLAACLYGNDYLNRSIITRVTPQLKELNNNLQTANNKLSELGQNNISVDISQLQTLVEEKARQTTVNQTLINQINREFDKIINYWKELRQNVEISQKSLFGLNKLDNALRSANRWEFERSYRSVWTAVILLQISDGSWWLLFFRSCSLFCLLGCWRSARNQEEESLHLVDWG